MKSSYIDCLFTDLFGKLRTVTIPEERIDDLKNGGVSFDGSSVEGYARINESDMKLKMDSKIFENPLTGRKYVVCDIYKNGKIFEGSPRTLLKTICKESRKDKIEYNFSTEMEFFLLDKEDENKLLKIDDTGYFSKCCETAKIILERICDAVPMKIEAYHHEVSPSQFEISFKYENALQAADNVIIFKYIAKQVSEDYGYISTFMPKPFMGMNGSGMHINMSVFEGGKNKFSDRPYMISFISGILSKAKEITAILNPTINSYKRLVPGFEAPTRICFSDKGRNSMIRIPESTSIDTNRIEVRSPDPTTNPYLAFAILIAAGNSCNGKEIFIKSDLNELPSTLSQSIRYMQKSTFVMNAIGESIFNVFISSKIKEIEIYHMQVHDWEIKKYLNY